MLEVVMDMFADVIGASFLLETYSNSKSKRYLRWLVFGSSTNCRVRLRRLIPRRLDFIFDLKPELLLRNPQGDFRFLARHVALEAAPLGCGIVGITADRHG